jgi:hypothetical protein
MTEAIKELVSKPSVATPLVTAALVAVVVGFLSDGRSAIKTAEANTLAIKTLAEDNEDLEDIIQALPAGFLRIDEKLSLKLDKVVYHHDLDAFRVSYQDDRTKQWEMDQRQWDKINYLLERWGQGAARE